jgi:hypothetical protein
VIQQQSQLHFIFLPEHSPQSQHAQQFVQHAAMDLLELLDLLDDFFAMIALARQNI